MSHRQPTRRARVVGSVLAGIVGVGVVASAVMVASAAPATTIGVTRTTVTVSGIVGNEAASTGADVGAQARFARANRRGGVAGRMIKYAGNVPDASMASSSFAVVPAVSDALDTASLAGAGVPFVGSAATVGWNANRYGFGFVGAQAALQTRSVSPAWGVQLRALLGTAQGSQVALAVDADELGAARAEQARVSLRAAGFRVATPVTLPPPPAALPDLGPVASGLTAGSPAAVLLLASPATTAGIAQQLARAGFTGTVGADAWAYQPTAPASASGLTVLVPYAPFEQRTASNRRLAADVEALAPGTPLTPGVAAGYWSADLFLRMLDATGKRLTRERFLATARRFSYSVPGTIGPSTWPAMHAQGVPCGALVQSDGTQFVVAEPYACGKALTPRRTRR